MKKLISFVLALSLLLCGCGGAGEENTDPSTDPSTEPSTQEATGEILQEESSQPETEAPAYCNPITGVALDQPITTRFVTVSIGNTKAAMPHHGLSQADMVFEVYVNDYITRLLALYTDPTGLPSIGSLRSHRYPFTDLAMGYDTFALCSGGSSMVINDAQNSGIDFKSVDTSSSNDYCFRDNTRKNDGYAWEHCLFLKGEGVYTLAENLGVRTQRDMEKDYGMVFAQGQALSEGEAANKITITFRLSSSQKDTIMTFNPETGLYEFSEYGLEVVDGNNGQRVSFRNVFVLLVSTYTDGSGYHIADMLGSGQGYFACDGYMIPIQWHRETKTDTFTFTLEDGTVLAQGVGSSYVAIVPTQSTVTCE